MPLVFKWKNAFGRKTIHESMKSELLTFPKGSKIAFETKEIASNDGNIVVEVGIQRYRLTNTKNQRSFYESI
jgi:hypothetical protein